MPLSINVYSRKKVEIRLGKAREELLRLWTMNRLDLSRLGIYRGLLFPSLKLVGQVS